MSLWRYQSYGLKGLEKKEKTSLLQILSLSTKLQMHIHGYCNLKLFGFSIYEYVVGFSRKDLSDSYMLDRSNLVILDQACFLFIIFTRYDLNQPSEELKVHIFSKKRNWGPSGRLTCMYNLPHL